MKAKLNPIFIIIGLFLFKIVLIDGIRNSTNIETQRRSISSERSVR